MHYHPPSPMVCSPPAVPSSAPIQYATHLQYHHPLPTGRLPTCPTTPHVLKYTHLLPYHPPLPSPPGGSPPTIQALTPLSYSLCHPLHPSCPASNNLRHSPALLYAPHLPYHPPLQYAPHMPYHPSLNLHMLPTCLTNLSSPTIYSLPSLSPYPPLQYPSSCPSTVPYSTIWSPPTYSHPLPSIMLYPLLATLFLCSILTTLLIALNSPPVYSTPPLPPSLPLQYAPHLTYHPPLTSSMLPTHFTTQHSIVHTFITFISSSPICSTFTNNTTLPSRMIPTCLTTLPCPPLCSTPA